MDKKKHYVDMVVGFQCVKACCVLWFGIKYISFAHQQVFVIIWFIDVPRNVFDLQICELVYPR